MPERACESCGNPEYFDEDPLTFFSFLQTHPPAEVPPDVAAFLAAHLNYAVADGARKLKIEKQIEGRATYVKLSGDLDSSFPREKLADGVEGDVMYRPLGHRQDQSGRRCRVAQLMTQIAGPTERILLVGCPAAFVERLTKTERSRRQGLVLSFSMPYSCTTCKSTSAREIDVAAHWDVLKFATPPAELKCNDCKGPVTCAASEALFGAFAVAAAAGCAGGAEEAAQAFSRRGAPKGAGRQVAGGGSGVRAATGSSAVGVRGGFSWTTVMVAVGIVIALSRRRHHRQDLRQSQRRRREAGGVAARRAPTGWITFFRESDRLLFVGHSTMVADKADGFAEAENGALEEVANQIGLSIREPMWIDEVRGQYDAFRQKAIGDLGEGDGLRRRRRGGAGHAAPRATDESGWPRRCAGPAARWRPTSATISTWGEAEDARRPALPGGHPLRHPQGQLRKAGRVLRRPRGAMGAKAVSYFPGLGWRYEVTEGAVVVKVANDSTLRFAGIQEGDLILAGMDCVVHDARSWKRVLDEESAALAKTGGVMVLKVKRGDAPAIDTRLRIAQGGLASAYPTSKCTRRAPAPAPPAGRPRIRRATSGTTTPKSKWRRIAATSSGGIGGK